MNNPHSFWFNAGCGAYTGMMGGLIGGTIITLTTSLGYIPIVIGAVGGIFVGSMAGMCWFGCSIKDPEQQIITIHEYERTEIYRTMDVYPNDDDRKYDTPPKSLPSTILPMSL